MARLIPQPLPPAVRADPGRAAERKVYEAFHDSAPEEAIIFFSRSWLGRPNPGKPPVEGEADFVVAHPDHGILIIEVKGGRVRYDAAKDSWYSRDRHGRDHLVDNPFHQAVRTKHALITKIKQIPAWRGKWIDAGHGVIFPDVARPDGRLGTDFVHEVTAFSEDLSWLDKWLETAFNYWSGPDDVEGRFGHRGMQMIEELLGASFELKHPLATDIADDEHQILRLTEDQFNVLDLLTGRRRVGISGGAGTGKTMLAMEKARRLAGEGFKTLLTCYNRPLADFLASAAKNSGNLTVMNFHTLCYEMGIKADCIEAVPEGESPSREYFEDHLPAALVSAMECRPEEKFDAIVVDEGQDFTGEWWTALQLALSDPDQGILYVFFDDNQRLYRNTDALPRDLDVFPLTKNLRNTKPIHNLANNYYAGWKLDAAGPEGREPEFIEAGSDSAVRSEVSRCLHRLVREEKVHPEDIAVLTGRSRDKSILGKEDVIGAFSICCGETPERGKVVFDSIRRFKGLERPVIILAELEEVLDSPEILYVGITRANAHLVVVGRREVIEALREHPKG
ncbi:MAG: NERD domain-containing protein [Pseudomonadota bacterium]|jgi:hypothetical protein